MRRLFAISGFCVIAAISSVQLVSGQGKQPRPVKPEVRQLSPRRPEVDPLLVNDVQGDRASSVKVVNVEFRIVSIDPHRIRGNDVEPIRDLFGLSPSDGSSGGGAASPGLFGGLSPGPVAPGAGMMGGGISRKLVPVESTKKVEHRVIQSEPLKALLNWLNARHLSSNSKSSNQEIALGSTVVVHDDRSSMPHLVEQKDFRTGATVHSVKFEKSGFHIELTPVAQVIPGNDSRNQKQGVWTLKVDWVQTSPGVDKDGKAIQKSRSHLVKLALGQTALIPEFVRTTEPAYVLLSVEPQKASQHSPEATWPNYGAWPVTQIYQPGTSRLRLAESHRAGSRFGGIRPTTRKPETTTPILDVSDLPLHNGDRVLELREDDEVVVRFGQTVSGVSFSRAKAATNVVTLAEPRDDSVRIVTGTQGVAEILVETKAKGNDNSNSARIEVVVRRSPGVLGHTLRKLYPNEKVELTPVGDAIVIRGVISSAIVARQIVEVAEQYYPRIMNQMESPEEAAVDEVGPSDGPEVGTEIRALRTDVKSLRQDIQKLIRAIEGQTDAIESDDGSDAGTDSSE